MKITTQLGVAAGSLFAASAIGLGSVYFFIYRIGDDVRVVNVAGMVRGGSQRLVKLELAGQQSDELMDRVDRLIKGLIEGDESLELPAATDPEVLAKNQAIAESWENLKTIILSFRENPSHRNRLIQQSESHWDLTNEGVVLAEIWSKRKLERYKQVFLAIFSATLCFLGVIVWLNLSIQSKIKKTMNTISRYSTEMAAAITEQEAITGQQAIAVNHTTNMMAELSKFSDHSVYQSINVNQSASEVKHLIDHGKNTEQQLLSDMEGLKRQVEELQTEIMELRQQMQQIANIAQLVSELANHTNILALNASMEATRAGENGKEFAVVAKEIRKLANQSQKASERIYNLISDIQKYVASTVSVTNKSRDRVDKGVHKTTEMLAAFKEIMSAINTVFSSSQEITVTARQQAEIIQQALSAIEEINRAAQESACGMSHAKNGMEQLKEVVSHLDAIV